MNGDKKKIQMVLCLLIGVGMFLPLYKISAYGQSASLTFMQVFDLSSKTAGVTVINCKIVLGILIAAFLVLLFRVVSKDNITLKIVSFLLILATGILFYIDVNKISAAKSLLSSMMKYGIGYYISLIGFIITIIFGLLDIFTESGLHNSRRDYPDDYDAVINSHFANENLINQITPPLNNQPTTPVNENKPVSPPIENNAIRLSDIVNNHEIDSLDDPNNDENINK